MSDARWLGITTKSSHVGIALSVISNFLLLLLIQVLPISILGPYKYLMIAFSVFSLFYTAVETFLQPLIHIYDDTCFIIQRKPFDYSHTAARAISSTYCGCLASSFTLFAVHFIYRYWAVCKPKRLRLFSGRQAFYWVLGVLVSAFSWAAFAFLCFPGNPRTQESFQHVAREFYALDSEEADYVAYTFWWYPNGSREIDWISIVGVAQHFLIMLVSFSIVFYCGTLTVIEMHKAPKLSAKTQQMQSQLFKALVFQTTVPTLFIYIPTLIVFLAPVFDLSIGAYGNLAIVTIHLYPGIDPLILLFLISDFRNAIGKSPQKAIQLTSQVFHRTSSAF